jgi:hypothetical protein
MRHLRRPGKRALTCLTAVGLNLPGGGLTARGWQLNQFSDLIMPEAGNSTRLAVREADGNRGLYHQLHLRRQRQPADPGGLQSSSSLPVGRLWAQRSYAES